MRFLILSLVSLLCTKAFSYQINQKNLPNALAHHSKNKVVFEVNSDDLCPPNLPDFLTCHEVRSALEGAQGQWGGVSQVPINVEFSFVNEAVSVSAIDGKAGDPVHEVTLSINEQAEILDSDIKIDVAKIDTLEDDQSTPEDYDDAEKLRVYKWAVLHSVGNALGLHRTDQVNPLLRCHDTSPS